MTAESDTAETAPGYRSSGSILRQAREDAGLTQEDVVADTRMTLYNVRALENDDFKRLPSDTFTRGYLRIYAKLLKLDVEPLVAAYEQTRRDSGVDPQPVAAAPQNRRGANPGRPLLYFIASILVVMALLWILSVWFLGNDSDTPASGAIENVVETDLVATTTGTGSVPALAETDAVELAATPEFSPEPGPDADASSPIEAAEADVAEDAVPIELPANETVQSSPLDRLELSFTDECWLVVTDAQGDVLVTDLVQPGQELDLQGQAPFEVRMGNAQAVQMSLNGSAYDLDVPPNARLMTVSVGQ